MERPQTQAAEVAIEREVVIAYLEREREAWIPARDRALRAGHNNAELNAAEAEHMGRIDDFLDELHALGAAAMADVIAFPGPKPEPPEIVA